MKKIIILFVFAFSFIHLSCSKNEEGLSDSGKDCVVAIRTVGEISVSESDLTKAGNSNSLYAVGVFKGSDNGDEPFAFGIFDDIQSMRLNLKQGFRYRISICMVKDAKNLISYYSLTNGGIRVLPSGPFYVKTIHDQYYYGVSGNYLSSCFISTNKFFYNNNGRIIYYTTSSSTSPTDYSNNNFSSMLLNNIRLGKLNDVSYPSCADWFYGDVYNYTPTGEFGIIDVPLKRTGFKLKYELSGVTDGQVTVKVYNPTRTFIDNTTTTATYESDTQFIAFSDIYSAWKYAENYTENMTVAVTWERGIGITQDLGSKVIQIKRNCLNNIRITLGNDDRGAGVSITSESDGMGTAENDINV